MACPYFMPAIVSGELRAARAPLGRVYTGACHAGPEPVTVAHDVLEQCNFGYARGVCPRFPDAAAADAVRYTRYQGRLLYVIEREHTPIEHGLGTALDPATTLGHQVAVFAANYP
jgi:hypothetical protein